MWVGEVEFTLLGDSGVSSYTPCYDKAIAKELGTLASGCRNMDRYRRRLIQKEGRGREKGRRKGGGEEGGTEGWREDLVTDRPYTLCIVIS